MISSGGRAQERPDELAARAAPAWFWAGVVALLAVRGGLAFFRLDREGVGYPIYAATVLSMSRGWHTFFYAAFDPAGFLAVDKPPLAFWVQTVFARVFGLSAWSVFAPQALASIASMAVLAQLVRRSHGPLAGLLAGLFLALSPISVAIGRTNLLDSQLVFVLLLAAWAALVASETGQFSWTLLAGILVGLAFLLKSMQVVLVVPALAVPMLLAPALPWRRRLLLLTAGTFAAVVIALPWFLVVDLTPSADRPYIGGTSTNREHDLVLHYNGVERLQGTANATPTVGPPARYPGPPGPLRLLDEQLGSQVGWLLPLAFAGVVTTRGEPGSRARAGWWLWVGWAVLAGVLLSGIPAYPSYYVATLAPALAALAGVGLATLWSRPTGSRLLPAVLVATAIVQVVLLATFPEWELRLTPIILVLSAVGAGTVLFGSRGALWPTNRLVVRGMVRGGVAVATLALLIAPAAWSWLPIWQGMAYRDMPYAGPLASGGTARRPASADELALMRYLVAHQGTARFLIATPDALTAAPLILATGKPVLPLGGYTGNEPVLSVASLGDLVAHGAIRFFVYVTGKTGESDFPTAANTYSRYTGTNLDCGTNHCGHTTQVFVTKLSTSLNTLLFSTFLGGDGSAVPTNIGYGPQYGDGGRGIAVDSAGGVYVTGITESPNTSPALPFPITNNAVQPTYSGTTAAFLSWLSPDLSTVQYSTYLGGGTDDGGNGIVVGGTGMVYVAGVTGDSNFPTTTGVVQPGPRGGDDGFAATMSMATPPSSGIIPWHPHYSARMADNLGASVDLADGHVNVSASDLTIPGRGPDLALHHTWDSTLAHVRWRGRAGTPT